MNKTDSLNKLFGSRSRVAVLQFLLSNEKDRFGVNEIIRNTGVNARLASQELKKLLELGILSSETHGNSLLYSINQNSSLIKPLKEIIVKSDWSEWERPSRIHHLVLTLEAGLKPMKEYYGYCLPYAHLVFNYDNVTWFFQLSEFQSLGKKLIPIYQKNKNQIWEDFERSASTLWSCKDYPSFYRNYLDFWKVAWATEPISFYIDAKLKKGEQIGLTGKSFTDEYEDAIWKLAKKAEKEGIEKIDVGPILKEYFWIRNSYHSVHRLTEEEVKTEIRKKMGKKRPRRKKGANPNSLSKELLTLGKEMILMQDIRKKYMMKAAYYLHEFLKQIGNKYSSKEHKLTPILMTQTLPCEVLDIKKYLPKLKQELELRQRSATITGSLADGIKVYSSQIFFPKGIHRVTKFEIRGNVACGGKAAGRVKIIRRIEDMYKVNHGDIIVAPMTSPDLIPAIRGCVAIVTNFGGITCHAAIVAREFNLPCIVGTNDATERLKDGDLVEVDADYGLVKVLQSEKE